MNVNKENKKDIKMNKLKVLITSTIIMAQAMIMPSAFAIDAGDIDGQREKEVYVKKASKAGSFLKTSLKAATVLAASAVVALRVLPKQTLSEESTVFEKASQLVHGGSTEIESTFIWYLTYIKESIYQSGDRAPKKAADEKSFTYRYNKLGKNRGKN